MEDWTTSISRRFSARSRATQHSRFSLTQKNSMSRCLLKCWKRSFWKSCKRMKHFWKTISSGASTVSSLCLHPKWIPLLALRQWSHLRQSASLRKLNLKGHNSQITDFGKKKARRTRKIGAMLRVPKLKRILRHLVKRSALVQSSRRAYSVQTLELSPASSQLPTSVPSAALEHSAKIRKHLVNWLKIYPQMQSSWLLTALSAHPSPSGSSTLLGTQIWSL